MQEDKIDVGEDLEQATEIENLHQLAVESTSSVNRAKDLLSEAASKGINFRLFVCVLEKGPWLNGSFYCAAPVSSSNLWQGLVYRYKNFHSC